MRLFTNDTILIDYGIKYLKVIGLSYNFSGVLQVLQGILKNCGYAGGCTMWCFAVPLGCIAAFVFKLPVMMVYFVLNLDELVKLPAVFKHYKQYKWLKNLTEMEN